MCKFSRGRLVFSVPSEALLMGTQPLLPCQDTEEAGDSSLAQHGALLMGKKMASSPEMLHPACLKGQLLPSHLQKCDPSQSIYSTDTVRYPPTHHLWWSKPLKCPSPPPQKELCFVFAPGSFREGALSFSVFGKGTTQAVFDKQRGSRSPCVTTEEASTNRQMFWIMAV